MKKITSIIVAIMMIATMFTAVPAYAEADGFAGGTGTKDDPFLISNAQQLTLVNELVNSGATYQDADGATKNYYQAAYKLTADIDYGNAEWLPLGQALPLSWAKEGTKEVITRMPSFKGVFDGANHVIKNVKITNSDTSNTSKTSKHVGFFGEVYSATIKNLGLDNIDIQWANHDYKYDTVNNKTERASYYGVFVGNMVLSNISNCYVVNSKVKNTNRGINDDGVGGFVGAMDYSNNITYCYVYNTEIQAAQNKQQAGFAGNCLSGTNSISNSYAAKIIVNRSIAYSTTYGFEYNNRTDLTTNTVENCYSTLADAEGVFTSNYGYSTKYTEAKSLGESGMTSDALIEAVLATGGYAVKANVNGGFPYLKTDFDGTPATSYDGGSGTEDDPFQIATPGQLLFASRQINAGKNAKAYFILTNDIDFNNQPWEPIGYSNQGGSADFGGGFDGNNHVVRNLTLGTGNYYYCGFFGIVTGATIKNLGIDNFQLIRQNTVTSQIRVVGGFVGQARSNRDTNKGTKITNCYIKNSSVKQTTNFGSGKVEDGNRVNIDSNLGGFVGCVDIRFAPVEITNCYADNIVLDAAIQGRACGFVGGVAEYNNNPTSVKLTNCYASRISNADPAGTQMGFGFTYTGTSYAFDEEKVILRNCYSTFSTVLGTSGSAKKIENTYGTEGALLRTIADAIESLNGWQNGDLINAGFPALEWETIPTAPDYTIKVVNKEIRRLNVTGGSGSYVAAPTSEYKVTVDIARKPGVTGTANVYVAGYDITGRLTGADTATVNLDDFSFTADINGKDATTVKVFVWNENQTPLVTDPYVATTSENTPLTEVWTPKVDENQPTRKTRVVMIGDSLMDSTASGTGNGWERFIGNYLADNTTVLKHGHSGGTVQMLINGRSTDKHWCNWESIRNEFGEGDVVILGLGTNDSSRINGTYSDPAEHYSVDQFKAWYKQIIADVKAKNATIVLLTPPPNGGAISNGAFYDPEGTPRTAIKEVAAETGVTVLDTTKLFADAINAYGTANGYTAAEMKATLDASGNVTAEGIIFRDYLHFTAVGADLMAKTVATELAKLTDIKDFIVLPAE